jgi:serine/threonine protein kinase
LLPEMHELAGQRLDSRYTVGDLLARGGFANVMDGYDHDQNRRCAIKVFRSELTNKEWITRRFKQEVAALQQVRHPHVVAIYAHGVAPSGVPYLVMEFVEGKSLARFLKMALCRLRVWPGCCDNSPVRSMPFTTRTYVTAV